MTEKPVALPSLPHCPDCGSVLTRRSVNMVCGLWCIGCNGYKVPLIKALPSSPAPTRKFRKKHTIEAVQWFKLGDHPAVRQVPSNHTAWNCPEQAANLGWLETLEGGNDGAQMVFPGDWIATGIQGEHWPIKPDIFAATYEAESVPSTPSPTLAEQELFRVEAEHRGAEVVYLDDPNAEDPMCECQKPLSDHGGLEAWCPAKHEDAPFSTRNKFKLALGVPSTPVETSETFES